MAASFPQTLISLVCSITLLLALATTPGDAMDFEYNFNGPKTYTNLNLEGDAHFTEGSNHLHMTKTDESGKALKSSAGRAVYSKPINFWDDSMQVDFETTITFIINPQSSNTDPADGFTFFIQPVGTPMGSKGSSFGVFDESGKKAKTFAIEFDIYVNTDDPKFRHIGVDFESNVSNKTIDVGDALLNQEVTARINYSKGRTTVHVTAGADTFELDYYRKDLSDILPQEVQVGISAATGGHVALYDVSLWYFHAIPVHTVTAEEGIRQVV